MKRFLFLVVFLATGFSSFAKTPKTVYAKTTLETNKVDLQTQCIFLAKDKLIPEISEHSSAEDMKQAFTVASQQCTTVTYELDAKFKMVSYMYVTGRGHSVRGDRSSEAYFVTCVLKKHAGWGAESIKCTSQSFMFEE